MTTEQALTRVLAMHPESNGVARICQELLRALTGYEVYPEPAEMPVLRSVGGVGLINNPWGCAGKPEAPEQEEVQDER